MNRGTATNTETRSCRMVSTRSAGIRESVKTTVARSIGGINTPSIWPKTWLRGKRFKGKGRKGVHFLMRIRSKHELCFNLSSDSLRELQSRTIIDWHNDHATKHASEKRDDPFR